MHQINLKITFYNLFISGAPVVATSEVPTTADDYLAMAKASQDKEGREQSVIRAANQSLKLRISSSGYFLRAYAKRGLGNDLDAISDYSKAIDIDRANSFNKAFPVTSIC